MREVRMEKVWDKEYSSILCAIDNIYMVTDLFLNENFFSISNLIHISHRKFGSYRKAEGRK